MDMIATRIKRWVGGVEPLPQQARAPRVVSAFTLMGLKNFVASYSSRHYDALRSIFGESLLGRVGKRRYWYEIDGWFHWRSAQEEAVSSFPSGSRFVEVGTYLGRSLCSLGEVVEHSGKII